MMNDETYDRISCDLAMAIAEQQAAHDAIVALGRELRLDPGFRTGRSEEKEMRAARGALARWRVACARVEQLHAVLDGEL